MDYKKFLLWDIIQESPCLLYLPLETLGVMRGEEEYDRAFEEVMAWFESEIDENDDNSNNGSE